LINDPSLVDKIDNLIKAVVAKGRSRPIGDNFRLYVTGYAQFFNEDDPGCNTVTFARSANPYDDGKPHNLMTTDLRKDFNDMSKGVNAVIQAAVQRNSDDGVSFVDIDVVEDDVP
jgi:hypothetical protein